MEADADYGSGSQPWGVVDRLDGTRFVRLYPVGSDMKGRIGTIDPDTGIVVYGSEQSLTNTIAQYSTPAIKMLTGDLGVIYFDIPAGGLAHRYMVRGFSTNADTGEIVDSSASTTLDNGFGVFQGWSYAGMLTAYSTTAFFGLYNVSSVLGRKLYATAMSGVTDKDTMNREADQVLIASSVSTTQWAVVWLNSVRTKGLVVYNDYSNPASTRIRLFSNATGVLTLQGTTYTEVSSVTDFKYKIAAFVGQGAVMIERDPGNAQQALIHFIDCDINDYTTALNSTVTVTSPAINFTAFGAENIDGNNVLLTATGSDGGIDSPVKMSAWVARCENGVFSITDRTDVTLGYVGAGPAAGEMSIAQLDNDWYVAQFAYVGTGACQKIKLGRI